MAGSDCRTRIIKTSSAPGKLSSGRDILSVSYLSAEYVGFKYRLFLCFQVWRRLKDIEWLSTESPIAMYSVLINTAINLVGTVAKAIKPGEEDSAVGLFSDFLKAPYVDF